VRTEGEGGWRNYSYRILAAEVCAIVAYFDRVLYSPSAVAAEDRFLRQLESRLSRVKLNVVSDLASAACLDPEGDTRTALVLNGDLNYSTDIQSRLQTLKPRLARTSRLVIVLYNPYLGPLFRLANFLKLRRGDVPITFLTQVALRNIARLAGYDVVRIRPAVYFPWRLLGLGSLVNRLLPLAPLLRWSSFAAVAVLRPVIPDEQRCPSLSIVIPARNEKGNIEAALQRMPTFPGPVEVIFVEGHSTDGTWQEIQRVKELYAGRARILALQQEGIGKADAVRTGFRRATGELLLILDADLTVAPELLPRFYEAYRCGLADFVNGSRLVYPISAESMRPLNRLGNIAFAKLLSWILATPLSDSLCGTKLLARHDYERMVEWRSDFGDFDPFGDFELLFPAAILGLGVVDVPIAYLPRTYGSTNISRFRHGLMLLRMTAIGLLRITAGRI
jgi:hypothetical protein